MAEMELERDCVISDLIREMENYGRRKPTTQKVKVNKRNRKPERRMQEQEEEKPAWNATPFDSSKGASAWETLPTKSIFDDDPGPSRKKARAKDWLSQPYPEEPARPSTRTARSPPQSTSRARYSPPPRRGPSSVRACPEPSTSYDKPSTSYDMPSTSTADPYPPARPSAAPRGEGTASTLHKKVLTNNMASRAPTRASQLDYEPDYDAESYSYLPPPSILDEGLEERLAQGPDFSYEYPYAMMFFGEGDEDLRDWFAKSKRKEVDTTPLPPWKPTYASQRLPDPNNPPPMFHPAFNQAWRDDPNISEDLRLMYSTSLSEYSGNHNIFDYGQLSEFNTLNLYSMDKLYGMDNDEGRPTWPRLDDGTEYFGDPREALAQPIPADLPDKYRKEKYKYFELKQRLELFKELGMEDELSWYPGVLERMEADPWTGDTSGRDVQVYLPGTEHDPAYDDDLLEQMEALCSPSNEGLQAFWRAMANPPPIREENLDEEFVADDGFKTANNSFLDDSFSSCTSETGESPGLNTTFTLPDAARAGFPPGIGPDDSYDGGQQ